MGDPTTLITFLGGSRGKDDAGYADTVYRWQDGSQAATDLFAEALLQRWNPHQMVLIGTRTSAWDHLAVRIDSPLFETLVEECTEDGLGIQDHQLQELEEGLSGHWGIPVRLYAHDTRLSNGNALEALMLYVESLDLVSARDRLLLDLSHGFRPMPVLLLSALRFQQALDPKRRSQEVRIVYGEYGGAVSKVRELDVIWDGMQVAESARRWFDNFAADELAGLLAPFWPEGSRALLELGRAIQGNDLQLMFTPLRALGGALKRPPEEPPPWFGSIFSQLRELYTELHRQHKPETLLALARRLARSGLYGQAYLILDEALIEVVLGSAPRKQLEWKEVRELLFRRLQELKKWHPWQEEDLWKIYNSRNFIAHGGRQEALAPGREDFRLQDLTRNFEKLCNSLDEAMHQPGSPLKLEKQP